MNNQLRNWRKAHGLTIDEVADLTGLSGAYISIIERGVKPVAPLRRVAIARALGVSVGELFPVPRANRRSPTPGATTTLALTTALVGLVAITCAGQLSLDDLKGRATCTVPEAAEVLGIGRGTGYEAAASGDLPVLHVGRRLLVPVAKLRSLLGVEPVDLEEAS